MIYNLDTHEGREAFTDRLIAAEAENAELRKDAERYRHMRKSARFQDRNGPGLYWYLPRLDHDLPSGVRLDNAIDAAMKGVKS